MKFRKSAWDVDNAANIMTGLMFIAILLSVLILVVAIILGLDVFSDQNVDNTTDQIRDDSIDMVANFFEMLPIVGTVLGVVILIAGIVILVMYVARMRNVGSTTSQFAG